MADEPALWAECPDPSSLGNSWGDTQIVVELVSESQPLTAFGNRQLLNRVFYGCDYRVTHAGTPVVLIQLTATTIDVRSRLQTANTVTTISDGPEAVQFNVADDRSEASAVVAESDRWTYALTIVPLSGGRLPSWLDEAALARVAEWAFGSRI
jgi:hypothetical protein